MIDKRDSESINAVNGVEDRTHDWRVSSYGKHGTII